MRPTCYLLLGTIVSTCALIGCGSSDSRVFGESSPETDGGLDAGVDVGAEASPADGSAEMDGPEEAPDAPVQADAADVTLPDADGGDPEPLPGLYEIEGSDDRWGDYAGTVEIRNGPTGWNVVHVHQWTNIDFEGDAMGLVWVGSAWGDVEPSVSFELERVGFVATYGGESHENVDPKTVSYAATVLRIGANKLEVTFVPSVQAEPRYVETWTRVSDPGIEPIWRNRRELVAMHAPPPPATKASLFQTYASFHAMPEVAPYVNRPDFQAAVHYQVFDPTDFEFYRANPNVLRVVQKSPDPIALVETRMRNRAYRQTLAQKQDYFEKKLPIQHLNTAGMLVDYDTTKTPPAAYVPSRDSMLWSGVYVASQAMRYLATQDASALNNMLRGLDGLILCHEIVGVEGEFARTIREHVNDGSSWVQGTGGYAAWDWLPGGNNDMLQGYYVGFTWAYKVLQGLPGYDARKQRMADILDDLVSNNPDAGDTKLNEMKGRMIRHWMTGSLQDKLTYEALYAAGKTWLVDQGNGPLWEYGTSDWSGNHLIIHGLLVPYVVSTELGDGHGSELSHGLRVALERMRHTRLGLFQMVGATLGDFPTPPPELEESLWVMREFPAPKVSHALDWRLNPSFCMSPFPSLPWKNDWTTNDRLDSLVAYPLFEKLPDVYAWKQGPFEFHDEASSVESSGVDYLFAYWFGRLHGVIQPGD